MRRIFNDSAHIATLRLGSLTNGGIDMLAQVIANTIKVLDANCYYENGSNHYWLTIANPSNDYDGFASAPALLEFNGKRYGKSGYNSDRGYISYTVRAAQLVATVIG